MGLLDGQRAVVTGGASGIGRATARRMAEEGASVAVVDINGDAAGECARSVGGTAHVADVTDPQGMRDAFDAAPLGEYDVIAVTGSLPVYDARFERCLRVGGRLFAVVGSAPVMDAVLVRRVDDNEWIRESLFETVIDPLVNATAAQRFVF